MSWSIGEVTIHPPGGGYSRRKEAQWAVQTVLDDTEDHIAWYGSRSSRRTLNGIIFDSAGSGLSTLEGYCDVDTSRALNSDQGSEGNYKVMSVNASRLADESRSYPVWNVVVDLLKV